MKRNKRISEEMSKDFLFKLCLYENRKIYLLNRHYNKLLPIKIKKITLLKNRLLKYQHNLKIAIDLNKAFLQDKKIKDISILEINLDKIKAQYKTMNSLFNMLLAIREAEIERQERERIKIKAPTQTNINFDNSDITIFFQAIEKLKKQIDTIQQKTENKYNKLPADFLNNDFFISHYENLKTSIKFIKDRIEIYKKRYKANYRPFIEKITIYDINSLLENKFTNNIKRLINCYFFYRLLHKLSDEKILFLNSPVKDYSNIDYSIIDSIIKNRILDKYSIRFLHKTI